MAQHKISDFPIVFGKKYLATKVFGRSFEWVRRHILTDYELTQQGIEIEHFKRLKDFPPDIAKKVKNIVLKKIN